MGPSGERPQIELRGLKKRGEILGAVLALEGASRAELKRASALGGMADRCLLVAVDGGLKTCAAARGRPDLLIGDGDSQRSRVPADVPTVVYSRDKNFSDFAGALDEMRSRRVQFVVVAGLLGGRVDHEWANLLELGSRSSSFAAILAPTDRGTVLVTRHGCSVATVRDQMFSIFSLGPSATVTLLGARWELERKRIRPGSHGLSNVTGTALDLTVHSGVVVLVLLPPRKRRKPSRARTAASAGAGGA
jgi:thiamine pyrophosphokinase